MNKKLFYFVLFLSPFFGVSQILEINNAAEPESTMSLQELVENVLISGVCSDVSNFSEQVNGTPAQSTTKSYGFFKRPVGSAFPFESGVILTNGNAFQAGNTLTNAAGNPSATNNLPGDADLNAALNNVIPPPVPAINTTDATFIKFDFVPTSNDFSFRFLMASEEYDGTFECQFSDGFAFLIREVGTLVYENLAVLPDGTPVNVTNINRAPGCTANPNFFEGYNVPDTNYGGRTVVLTAQTTVVPGTRYEIKLAVADAGTDSAYDSAVFLEAGSFNLGLDLGDDLTITNNSAPCDGNTQDLSTGFPGLVHTWSLDGVVDTANTSDIYNATETGTYSVEVIFAAGCTGTDEIFVEFADRPILNSVDDQMICDDNNDGFWTLDDLPTLFNATVYGTQSMADYTVTYHETEDDADENESPITAYTNLTAYQQEEIFIRIENNISTTCYETDSFLFDVFDAALPNDVIFRLCDDAVDGSDINGFLEFDLNAISARVVDPQNAAQFNVTYHFSSNDASNNTGAIVGTTHTNGTAGSERIFARMENVDNSSCFDVATIDLIVDPLPVVTPIVTLTQCDDDTDGITQFNLTEANILISADAVNETFTYYLTDADAQGGDVADQIVNFTAYPNPNPLTGTVYARIETDQECWRTAQINLIVGATQIPANFQRDYEECDDALLDDDNAVDGIATFDFSNAEADVKALFPVGAPITVTFYTNLADAQAETNAIPDTSNHRNDTSPNLQLIYVRVDSDDVNACLGLGQHVTLTVNPQPLPNLIEPFILCSDNAEPTLFDLTTKDDEVTDGQAQTILVSYHRTLEDAQNNDSPIVGDYLNTSPIEIIYVRAQFDDNGNDVGDPGECVRTNMSFELRVIPNPVIMMPEPIRVCNDETNTEYVLTDVADEITGGDSTITLAYYETQLDLDNDNPIINPAGYISTSLLNTIFVEATGTNTCTSTTTIELITTIYAALNLTPEPLEECEIDNDGIDEFDLRRSEEDILAGLDPMDFIFRYYLLETDAEEGNANFIDNFEAFENTEVPTQTIYVRIDPIANMCSQVAPLTLQVNQVPEIQIEEEYVLCLDANDNPVNPTETTLLPNPPIDTQLSDTEYSFLWYQGDDIPENLIAGETGSTYTPTEPGDYTVIATDRITDCTIPATTSVVGSYPPESITVEVISNAFSENNTIEVTVVGNGTYEYNVDFGPWQDSPIFENLLGGEHTIYVRDTLNCGQVFTMFIVIDYPKYFTPNDDTRHDTWNIRGIKDQPNAKIYIFDRYGKLLKQLSSVGDGWDGTFNGEKVPSSDYWFTVEFIDPIDDTMKIFKAHFTLKR